MTVIQFDSVSDFLAMGGYGGYVWLSYALAAMAVGVLIGHTVAEHRSLLRRKARAARREDKA